MTLRCSRCGFQPTDPAAAVGDRCAECQEGTYTDTSQGEFDFAAMPPDPSEVYFDGETYEHDRDKDRLAAQASRVYTVIRDGEWHTLADLSERAHAPQASVSARLRDFRKPRFGAHVIERRYVTRGLFEYRLADGNGNNAHA